MSCESTAGVGLGFVAGFDCAKQKAVPNRTAEAINSILKNVRGILIEW
jgi:hypothetical protein